MIFEFYFYVFYSYFLKKNSVGEWIRACGIVCLSIGGILNLIFLLFKKYQIIDIFNSLVILRILMPIVLFAIVYFAFGYKEKEKNIVEKFYNHPIDSELNRILCWLIAFFCILGPLVLAMIFREGDFRSIPWTSH